MTAHAKAVKRVLERVERWSNDVRNAKFLLGDALEGLEDSQARSVLEGALYYGWRRPNGEWRDAPK